MTLLAGWENDAARHNQVVTDVIAIEYESMTLLFQSTSEYI